MELSVDWILKSTDQDTQFPKIKNKNSLKLDLGARHCFRVTTSQGGLQNCAYSGVITGAADPSLVWEERRLISTAAPSLVLGLKEGRERETEME